MSTETIERPTRTDFTQMSRSELLAAKADIEAKLRAAKAELAQAKRDAWSRGERIPADEFNAMNDRVARLAGAASRAQSELAVMSAKQKEHGARLNDLFVEAARQMLDHDTYFAIVERAREFARP